MDEYLVKFIDEKFNSIDARLEKIEMKIDSLNEFRWKLIGIVIGLVSCAEIIRYIMGN